MRFINRGLTLTQLLAQGRERPMGVVLASYPGSLLTRGWKIEPGIKCSRMCQIVYTFRVNRNLQDTSSVYVASGMSGSGTNT